MGKSREKYSSELNNALNNPLSPRNFNEYIKKLEIDEKNFNNPESFIVDLDAGLSQEFARDSRKKGFKNKILSVDPRLGIEEKDDLAGLEGEAREIRKQSREKAE